MLRRFLGFVHNHRKAISITVIVLLILYVILQLIIPPQRISIDSISTSNSSISVLTYNVEYGLSNAGIDVLKSSQADIIALQEVYDIALNEQELSPEVFAQELNYSIILPEDYVLADYGLLILSKFPIQESTLIQLPGVQWTREYGLYCSILLITPTTETEVCTTHFANPIFPGSRNRQAKTILTELSLERPTILMGDFNTPNSILDPVWWKLTGAFSDGYGASVNTYSGQTWYRNFPVLRVDYVFITDHWSVLQNSTTLHSTTDSDHKGLQLVLQLSD